MNNSVAIGLISAALGFASLAAENNQNALSTSAGKGLAAMQQAAGANKYLFAFVYEKDDEATRAARKTLDEGLKTIAPAPVVVAVDRTAAAESELVAKFGLAGAPMPLVLAIAPNGAVTGGFKATDATQERLQAAVASPCMQQCLKALQERKLVFICLQNARTAANEGAMKGVNEFVADPRFAQATQIVKVDPTDTKESKLLAQLKVDPKAKTANTALLAPPGVVVTSVEGATSKDNLVAALTKVMASCGSGCGPSGCGPAPAK